MSGGLSGYVARHARAAELRGHMTRVPVATIFTVLVMGLAALPLGLDVLVRNVRTATGDFSGAVSLSVFLRPASLKRALSNWRAPRASARVARCS